MKIMIMALKMIESVYQICISPISSFKILKHKCKQLLIPCSLNRRNSLHQAVIDFDMEKVKDLIYSQAYINAEDNYGNTPLHLAAVFNKTPEIVNLLIANGACINLKTHSDGWTPLHQAVSNNPEIVKALIRHGAIIDSAAKDGCTPLHYASLNKHALEIVEILVNNGAKVNKRNVYGATPLLIAAVNCDDPIVFELLVRHGANAHISDNQGRTPLDTAKQHNNTPAVAALTKISSDT